VSAARLAHLLDQLEGAALSVAHAEASTDAVVRDTVTTHARTYDEIATEIEHLCVTSPEARAEFFHTPEESA
jgi:hypothetical protein